MIVKEETYLEHYGVKGMKWYQHIFGDYQSGAKYAKKGRGDLIAAHTIKKGTKMYRTTADANEGLNGSKYVTYLNEDRNLYKGSYAWAIKKRAGKTSRDSVYEKEYELQEDLNIPSRETLRDAYSKVMSNERTKKQAIQSYISELFERDLIDYKMNYDNWEQAYKNDVKQWTDKTIKEWETYKPDERFSITARSLGMSNPAVKNSVIKELSSKGYNAMVDEAGVGGLGGTRREGIEPLIIFNSSSSLKETSTNVVNQRKEFKATNDYNKWERKVNSSSSKKKAW